MADWTRRKFLGAAASAGMLAACEGIPWLGSGVPTPIGIDALDQAKLVRNLEVSPEELVLDTIVASKWKARSDRRA